MIMIISCCCCNPLWQILTISLTSLLIVVVICYSVVSIFKKNYILQEKLKTQQHDHEASLRRESFEREKEMFDIEIRRKSNDLERKIKEFKELTIQQKLLDKVIEKKLDQNIKDLQSSVDKLKGDLEKAKVEISG